MEVLEAKIEWHTNDPYAPLPPHCGMTKVVVNAAPPTPEPQSDTFEG